MLRTAMIIWVLLVSKPLFAEDDIIHLTVSANSPSFTVTLPANPTTGYQWVLKKYDNALLSLSSSQYEAENPKLMGSGGHMLFQFSVVGKTSSAMNTKLIFVYQRPWEKESVKQQVVDVCIQPNNQ